MPDLAQGSRSNPSLEHKGRVVTFLWKGGEKSPGANIVGARIFPGGRLPAAELWVCSLKRRRGAS